MSGHTSGPWLRSWSYNQRRLSIKSGFAEVAAVRALACQDANAHLIAAAPEMLEALQKIAEGKGRFDTDHYQFSMNVIDEAKETARLAIAKATGGR